MTNPFRIAARKTYAPPELRFDEMNPAGPVQVINWHGMPAEFNEWSTERAIRYGYKSAEWVYACTSKISRSAASVPLLAGRKHPNGEKEPLHDHPYTEFLNHISDYVSGQDWIERKTLHLLLGGNAIDHKIRVGGRMVALEALSPDEVKPIPHPKRFIEGYEWRVNGKLQKRFPREDIAHQMLIDPANPRWGVSPLMALAKTVDTDVEAVKWNFYAMKNRAVTDGAFTADQPLSRKQWEELRQQIRDQHQGSEHAREPWVLGGGAKWQQMSLSPAEMDFIESRKLTRESICGLYGVPPPLVGIYAFANYKIETSRRIYWEDTVIPLLDDLIAAFDQDLAPEFGPDIVTLYDLSNVSALGENLAERIDTAHTLWRMGLPFSAINKRLELGFDEFPGWDQGWLPMSMIPSNSPVTISENGNRSAVNGKETLALSDGDYQSYEFPDTDEQRDFYWKDVERIRTNWYERVASKVLSRFRDEVDTVVAGWTSSGASGAQSAVEDEIANWITLLRETHHSVIEDFGNISFEDLKSGERYSFKQPGFDIWDQQIQNWINTQSTRQATLIGNTTWDQVADVIGRGTLEGQSTTEIASNIRTMYTNQSVYRSTMISRTAVVGSSNAGSYYGAQQAGTAETKAWVSSRDERVRDTHWTADGSEVGMDDHFVVGDGRLMFPGDPDGPPEEIIHCRCALAFRRSASS